jgi:RimJ/RimL family protein N-acetyltransferase
MLAPIHIENKNYLIHSFRPEDMQKEKSISLDIYAILSDAVTLRYLPGKKMYSLTEAELYFRGNLLSFHASKNYLHFITDKQSGQIVGMIDVITPEVAREHYHFDHYPYFIEFYLKSDFQGRHIMSQLLPAFVRQLQKQNIIRVGAVVNRNNLAAQKVLEKAGFTYLSEFDLIQDFYMSA